MSTISGIPATSYVPNPNQVKPAAVTHQPATPPVPPVVKDADGDNDGSKGGNIDIYA